VTGRSGAGNEERRLDGRTVTTETIPSERKERGGQWIP
jgi:hypothetical protein